MSRLLTLVLVLGSAPAAAQTAPAGPVRLRYDLQAGDHLVYRQTLEREIDGRAVYGVAKPPPRPYAAPVETLARAEWTVHVIVPSAAGGVAAVGVERTRSAAELVRFHAGGEDQLQQQRAAFEERHRSTVVTTDAAHYDTLGVLRTPPSLVREWPSKVLWAISPVVPLAPAPVEPGDRWMPEGPLGFAYQAMGWETAAGESCLKVEGTATADLLIPRTDGARDVFRVRYWFCPASGVVRKLEFAGEYPTGVFEKVTERVTLELLERRRGETPATWEAQAETREAARAARTLADVSAGPRVEPVEAAETNGSCAADSVWTEGRIVARRAPPALPGTRMRGMTSQGWRGWPYAIRVPDGYRGDRPAPVLVYLGGNLASAIEAVQSTQEAVAATDWLVLYPNAGEWWWRDSAAAMTEALLEEAQREYNVDSRRIYLSGLSNGGTGTFYYATLWPHRLSAAVSAMGAGIFIMGAGPDELPFPGNTANLPMLFLHGERDRTISPDATRRTVKLMRDRRAPVETHYFPDRGHELVLGRGDDGLTLRFLERWTRGAPPRTIRFEIRSAGRARHYWVELLERAPAVAVGRESGEAAQSLAALLARGDPAWVEGKVGDDNAITLKTHGVRKLRLLLRRDLLPKPGPVRVRVDGKEVFAGELPPDCAVRARSLAESADPFLAYDAELVIEVPGKAVAPGGD